MRTSHTSAHSGFSLVELMIAMVLGLLVLMAVTGAFLSQRQVYRVTENLARMQGNARVAFELLARDLREAGGNPCGAAAVSNVINGSAGSLFDWAEGGVIGYEPGVDIPGVPSALRAPGTDGILVRSSARIDGAEITAHNTSSGRFTLGSTGHGLSAGDIVMVCDSFQAAIFQLAGVAGGGATLIHGPGGGASVSPGNCSTGLGFPTDCSSPGKTRDFSSGHLSRVTVTSWYVGDNGRGGRSLFRVENGASPMEVAEGVEDLQVEYLTRDGANLADAFVDANGISDWSDSAPDRVVAVRMAFSMASSGAVGVDGNPLRRRVHQQVSLRYRELVQ